MEKDLKLTKELYYGIQIDKDRNSRLKEDSLKLLKDFYLLKDEDPQEGFARAAIAFSTYDGVSYDMSLAQRIYDYVSKGWFMYSSPVLSNAPKKGENPKSMPISCFLTHVEDSLESLIDHTVELRWLSVMGGGVGGHWSSVRSVSEIAPGPIPFLQTVDADMTAYRQGKTRKGSYAAYLDISHPDIEEFLNIRVPTGDSNRKCLNLHNAINISDEFMIAVEQNKEWNLIDPKDGSIRNTLSARKLWESILETRYRTGEPYLCFIDTANRGMKQYQKNLGLKIRGSNLCSEIFLTTSSDRTAVCCLSSVNIEKYDEWKNTTMVQDLVVFLDNVLEFFIRNAPEKLSKAKYSAYRERSIGLGAMGWHSYLQKNMIPFGSKEAYRKNQEIFSKIYHEALVTNAKLATERGECPDAIDGKQHGWRLTNMLAIAPNASSSTICGTSPSIEPEMANGYVHRSRIGSHLVKNKYLEEILETYGRNDSETWSSIVTNGGSVQHLDFLTTLEREVFKTFSEIDQEDIIRQAANRQIWIDQGQSVNLKFPSNADKNIVNKVHYLAWKLGLKSLYYLRTEAASKAEVVSKKVETKKLQDSNESTCVACEG